MILNVAAYQFVRIDDPAALAARLHAAADQAGLRGTVLVAPEGINLFLAGAAIAVRDYVDDLLAEQVFENDVIKDALRKKW